MLLAGGQLVYNMATLLDCHIAVGFVQKVLCWFNEKENSSITLNSKKYSSGQLLITNKKTNFQIYANFYMYFHSQKINQCECIWNVFVRKLSFMLNLEGFASFNLSSVNNNKKTSQSSLLSNCVN